MPLISLWQYIYIIHMLHDYVHAQVQVWWPFWVHVGFFCREYWGGRVGAEEVCAPFYAKSGTRRVYTDFPLLWYRWTGFKRFRGISSSSLPCLCVQTNYRLFMHEHLEQHVWASLAFYVIMERSQNSSKLVSIYFAGPSQKKIHIANPSTCKCFGGILIKAVELYSTKK